MQHSFEELSEKQRRVELKPVENCVAKIVFVENVNQFYWNCCIGHTTVSNIFRRNIVNRTVWKNLKVNHEQRQYVVKTGRAFDQVLQLKMIFQTSACFFMLTNV